MYAAVMCASFLLLFWVIFWSTARYMERQIDTTVSSEITEILADARSGAGGLKAILDGLINHSPDFYYLLQSSDGRVLAGNLPAMKPVEGTREWEGSVTRRRQALSGVRGRGVSVGDGFLFVGLSTLQLHEMREMIVSSFLWGLGAAMILALSGGAAMSLALLRKIENVSQASRDIVAGDLNRRIALRGSSDEFDHLAVSLNTMLDRIQALMDDLRKVTTDIAHDLRTPLTRLRQRLELAQRADADPDSLRLTLAAARDEIDGVLQIFGALLRIAQIESGARTAGFSAPFTVTCATPSTWARRWASTLSAAS